MNNKKCELFVLSLMFLGMFVFLLSSNGVFAQVDPGQIQGQAEDIQVKVDEGKDFVEQKKWEYLGAQWKEVFLKNKYISTADRIIRKGNFIFVFLFGEDYDLSLTLLLIILVWVMFLVYSGEAIANFATFSKDISYIISFLLVIVMAHLNVFLEISNILFKVIFFKEGVWGWIAFFLFMGGYVVLMLFVRKIINKIGKKIKKKHELSEKEKEKSERKVFHKRVEGIEEAFDNVEEAFKS